MQEVAKTNYLERSKDSGMYYFRRAIPQDLKEALKQEYPSGVIKKSLRTKNVQQAREACRLLSVEIDQQFAAARHDAQQATAQGVDDMPSERPLSSLTALEIRRMASRWLSHEITQLKQHAEDYAYRGIKRQEINRRTKRFSKSLRMLRYSVWLWMKKEWVLKSIYC
jgi:hypothetical protein